MKIVVVGGSGLIGSKLVNKLRQRGHNVTAASLEPGVNLITGEGLNEALKDADTQPNRDGRGGRYFFPAGRCWLADFIIKTHETTNKT